MQERDLDDLLERTQALEIRLAYQDQFVRDLDDVLQRFVQKVEHLEGRLTQLEDNQDVLGIGPANEKPPHY